MLKRFLASWRDRGVPRPPTVVPKPTLPDGHRIYAVGDIHGRADLLARMRGLVADDISRNPPGDAVVVLLGDYVDRGPDSRGVVESLATEPFAVPAVYLLGNHEAMLLEFLRRPEIGEAWRRFGGVETAHSYGVDLADLKAGRNLAGVSRRLQEAIPPHHLSFLESLKLQYRAGDFFFCHAGVRPGVPLEEQREEDLLWIRDDFVGCSEPLGAVVVHGHTPEERPSVRDNAIGIDTGAYITGRLTCAVLDNAGLSFLST